MSDKIGKRDKITFEDAALLQFKQQYKEAKTIHVQVNGKYYPTTKETIQGKAKSGLLIGSDLTYFTKESIQEAQKKK